MERGRYKDSEYNHSKVTIEHIKAAVRGMWRMGTKTDEIAEILQLTTEEVKKIIKNYSNGKNYRN